MAEDAQLTAHEHGGSARVTSRAVVFSVMGVLVAWLCGPTLMSLHERWITSNYSHGYLIAALSFALIVRELRKAPLGEDAPSIYGLACLFLGALGVVIGHAASMLLVSELLFPVVCVASFWAVSGARNARRLAAPIAYLYFALPWWDAINEPLRALTVLVVSTLVQLADIPAHIEGSLIHIPSGTFEVSGGCSGLHYVIVGLALGALTGLLHQERWRPRIALCAIGLVLALVANWLRVFIIVVAGHTTDMQHSLIVDGHYYFGWALFLAVVSPLVIVDRWLQRYQTVQELQSAPPRSQRPAGRLGHGLVALAMVTLLANIALRLRSDASGSVSLSGEPLHLADVPGWTRAGDWYGTTRPSFVGAAREAAATYVRGGDEVAAYLAHYPMQRQGHEVVFYANRPQGLAATVISHVKRFPASASGATLPFAELEVADDEGGRRLVWFEMRVAGALTAYELIAKGLQIAGAFTKRRDAQALVLAASCTHDCESARRTLEQFITTAADSLYEGANPVTTGGVERPEVAR